MTEHYLIRKNPATVVPSGCGRYVKLGDKEGGGPEYETIWAYGSDCGVDDFEAVMEANFLCNELITRTRFLPVPPSPPPWNCIRKATSRMPT